MCLAAPFIIASCLAGCLLYSECGSLDVKVIATVCPADVSECANVSESALLDISIIEIVSRWSFNCRELSR